MHVILPTIGSYCLYLLFYLEYQILIFKSLLFLIYVSIGIILLGDISLINYLVTLGKILYRKDKIYAQIGKNKGNLNNIQLKTSLTHFGGF